MEFMKIPTFLICMLAVAVTQIYPTHGYQTDFLVAHNLVRAKVGVGPLVWNNTVAAYAQDYADQRADCNLIHSQGPYGENLAISSEILTGADAVKMWADEKSYYDYPSNSCVGGGCVHYTQVVWRTSTQLGCGTTECQNGWHFVTCNYYPPGNYIGERPY